MPAGSKRWGDITIRREGLARQRAASEWGRDPASAALGLPPQLPKWPDHVLVNLWSTAWAAAGIGAAASVLLNNLPAAALLSAQLPPHPNPLLVGLHLGPNLAVTGRVSPMPAQVTLKSCGRL